MIALTGFIDPPGPFSSKDEWAAFIAGLRKLPSSPDVDAAIEDATEQMARAPEAEDDDFSDLK